MNILQAIVNFIYTGNFEGITKEMKREIEKEYKEELERIRLEPGICREYKAVGHTAFARIREAGTGNEIWRKRAIHEILDGGVNTKDYPLESFNTLDQFIQECK